MYDIPFNKASFVGNELRYIQYAIDNWWLSGNGPFTKKCHNFFTTRYSLNSCLLTVSGTAALEMAAILAGIEPGDEVILPSYTFTSTANAFAIRGARLVFADSQPNHPNIDLNTIEELITDSTKALCLVHYAGMACDMDRALAIARKHKLLVIEDAAHAIESTFRGKQLGTIGDFGTFSFHETKNVMCGEGGLLLLPTSEFSSRAEIIWQKGTNRMAFHRGEVKKYEWVDIGSSFLPSELAVAFLYAQLEKLDEIQHRRIAIWSRYHQEFKDLEAAGAFRRPEVPEYASINGHLYYVVLHSKKDRDALIAHLGKQGILAVFHYQPLHASPYFHTKHDGRELPHAMMFSERLLRFPLFYSLSDTELTRVIDAVKSFFS